MDMYPLSGLKTAFRENIDLFICSASFESRCRVVADAIDRSKVLRAGIARNVNHAVHHGDNPAYLRDVFQDRFVDIFLDSDNPLIGGDAIWKVLSSTFNAQPKRCLIDLSTLTHEAVLILLRAFKLLARPSDHIVFAYVPAEYDKGAPHKDKWLSKGIREIRSVLGYPGELVPSRKIHLVILVGFETERARALIEAYEPSRISLGYGEQSGSTSKENYEANEYFHNKIMTLFPNSDQFTFSPTNFVETANVLAKVIAMQKDMNTVLAPLNTKLSTVGCALAAMNDETIQLCYAQAEIYNYKNYSTPKDTCFLFRVRGIGSD